MESSTMREAFDEIQRLSEDPATRAAAISREIHLKDQIQRELDAKAVGKLEVEQKGRQEGKAEIVLNMYTKQYPIEAIADATSLSMDDVLRIVESSLE